MDGFQPSILSTELLDLIGTAAAPSIVDIRSAHDLAANDRLIPGAILRAAEETELWWPTLPASRPVVVCDLTGDVASQRVTAQLARRGIQAGYLNGGVAAWYASDLPTRAGVCAATKWVTRERPKIDRIACPWLVQRFINPLARFLYVPADQVRSVADATGATPYDVQGVEFTHVGDRCSFDRILDVYDIRIPALDDLADIVRGADTSRHDLAPECSGLVAISRGLSANFSDDHDMLAHGLVIYDALYSWCRMRRMAANG